ncbi:PAS domain S-box protein [Horticoccus luteus]|uniref:histidine kinase n=1 Tax=Horticoccus luteus TaxID=2862869 RepID=A0A8F9XJW3_9BACT|nr:PAS domain S-box protein [Horticoccus luteus]QYM79088.1 PAS domain S-box protein [Horticoccus luteus]
MRNRLRWLVAGITATALLLVGVLTAQAYFNQRTAAGRHLVGTARALSSLVDRQLGETEALLKGLAISGTLQRGDFAAFDTQARSLAPDRDRWIVVTDAAGHEWVNTRLPRGQPLPNLTPTPEIWAALRQKKTYFSDVRWSTTAKSFCVNVSVPVLRDGELLYGLHYVIQPSAFARAIAVERFLPGAIVTVVDRTGTITARNRGAEKFAGKKATPDIVEATTTTPEGIMHSRTLEGIDVVAAYSRSPVCGWSVAIGAPEVDILASARRVLWLGGALSGLLVLVALILTRQLGRKVSTSIAGLVAETEALGQGLPPPPRPPGLQEIDFVATAMQSTAARLREREQETVRLTHLLQDELAKQKESELVSRRLAAIVTSSEDAIISKTLESRILTWNRGAERIFGYTEEEMIGQSITVLLPRDRLREEDHLIAQIRRGQRISSFETVRQRKDGSLVDISLSISPLRDANGQIVGASKIARDITDRRHAEARQRAVYELVSHVNRADALNEIYPVALRAIYECQRSDRAAILLLDDQKVMRFVATSGLSAAYCEAVEGHSPWAHHTTDAHPIYIDNIDLADQLPAPLKQALRTEGIHALAFIPLTLEKRLLGKFMVYYNAPHVFSAAELQPVETIATQVAFAVERHRSAEAMEQLVAERTASLQEAVTQMQEFSYSVSHDLRAPVRAMRGYAEVVLEDYGERLGPDGRMLLSRIVRSGARMDRLIQDLLTYSRLNRRDLALEPVSLEKLVHEVVQQYPDMRPERAEIAVEGPLPEVIGHEPSLSQVVSNLLSNAVKFVPPESRPRIRVAFERTAPDRGRLWFEDNGIGIKPEHQSRLFGLFERVHPEHAYEGTGIGLAIVRKAVERMNGSVGVHSDGVSGSRFWIELSLASRS